MFLTKANLARELNVTPGAVDKWLVRGLRPNARGRFDRERALAWVVENVEPQLASSGVSRGSTRASELLKKSKRDDRSNGGNGHDTPELNAVQQRARRDLAMAERIELQNAVSRNELVYVGDVVVEVAGELAIVRARFLGLPSKLAPSLAAANTPEATYRLLYDAIVEVLTALSSGDDERDEAA